MIELPILLLFSGLFAVYAMAFSEDAKREIMDTDEYIAWKKELDPTYTKGEMQTVTVVVDGKKHKSTFHGDQVKDIFYLYGIDLEDSDTVKIYDADNDEEAAALGLEKPLKTGDKIEIKSDPQSNNLKFVHYTPLIPDNQIRIVVTKGKGALGKKVFTFEPGTPISSRLLKKLNRKKKLTQYRYVWFYVGKSDAHISVLKKGFEGVKLDENNKPLKFKKKLENMKTVAYSTNNRRTKTASGMPTIPGNVAIRPADIEPGTKLFIVSKDGELVYGNAVAADTGSGLDAGVCDLDVVTDSYLESCWFGERDMECYVLED
ncbi:MAG: hypothetical protein LBB04_03660 [Oscillospiraceae bacterium]|nr:hypothetical protein [Oscillospiraceae bacterium]